jgi:hypothetical protein
MSAILGKYQDLLSELVEKGIPDEALQGFLCSEQFGYGDVVSDRCDYFTGVGFGNMQIRVRKDTGDVRESIFATESKLKNDGFDANYYPDSDSGYVLHARKADLVIDVYPAKDDDGRRYGVGVNLRIVKKDTLFPTGNSSGLYETKRAFKDFDMSEADGVIETILGYKGKS